MNFKKIYIILCVYNEAETILQVLKSIPDFFPLQRKILVINDGSRDSTVQEANKADCKIISNSTNRGLGFSLKKGLRYALKKNADYIAILDADGQYRSTDLRPLIQKIIKSNVDLVIGNRFLKESSFETSLIHKLANMILSFLLSKVILRSKKIYDTQSSFRVFNSNLASVLQKFAEFKFNYAQEMILLAFIFGFKISQIPIRCFKRKKGKSRLIKNRMYHFFRILIYFLKRYIQIRIRVINS